MFILKVKVCLAFYRIECYARTMKRLLTSKECSGGPVLKVAMPYYG